MLPCWSASRSHHDCQTRRSAPRRRPVRPAARASNVQLEATVPLRQHLMPKQVGFGNIAERLVQTGPVGSGLLLGSRTLDGEVEEPRGSLVAADLVDGFAVNPGL